MTMDLKAASSRPSSQQPRTCLSHCLGFADPWMTAFVPIPYFAISIPRLNGPQSRDNDITPTRAFVTDSKGVMSLSRWPLFVGPPPTFE